MIYYLAQTIIDGRKNYNEVFSTSLYQKYRNEVDTILKSKGYEHLIIK